MRQMSDNLKITFNHESVGELKYDHNDDVFEIIYDDPWIKKGFAISPHIPLEKAPRPHAVEIYLKNLFPEGRGLDILAGSIAVSKDNTFALIRKIGADVSGALAFGPDDQDNFFRPISEKELAERIANREHINIAEWDGDIRMSVAGVQEKLPVTIRDGVIGLGGRSLPSTHILKFGKKEDDHIVLNEFFCMRLAKACKLNVANVELKHFGEQMTLVVERFDRMIKDDQIKRIHVIDGCQLLGVPPTLKYEHNFGSGRDVAHVRNDVSFAKLFGASKSCKRIAKARLSLLEWAMFNLIISNADAHAKNISFFVNRQEISVAPMYDLLNIAMHPKYHQELAMAFGDEFNSNEVKGYALRDFSEVIGENPKVVSQQTLVLIKAVRKALPLKLGVKMSAMEQAFIKSMEAQIKKRCEQLEDAANQMLEVSY
jgi:serine/threonine-protein kinase HipA